MLAAMQLLGDAVSLVDAMGYDAHVYYEEGKRYADIVSHSRDVGEKRTRQVALMLVHRLEGLMHMMEWNEVGRN